MDDVKKLTEDDLAILDSYVTDAERKEAERDYDNISPYATLLNQERGLDGSSLVMALVDHIGIHLAKKYVSAGSIISLKNRNIDLFERCQGYALRIDNLHLHLKN